MTATKEKYYRTLFRIAAVYDIVLGVIFTFFPARAFSALGIFMGMPTNCYVTLLGAFVLVIGVAYYLISRGDLRKNLDLIMIGALYKFAYTATAFYYCVAGRTDYPSWYYPSAMSFIQWATAGLPHPIFAVVFGVADAIFFVLMAECFLSLKREKHGQTMVPK
jgi:hypothetical protein